MDFPISPFPWSRNIGAEGFHEPISSPQYLRPFTEFYNPNGSAWMVLGQDPDDGLTYMYLSGDDGADHIATPVLNMAETIIEGVQVVGEIAQPFVYLPIKRSGGRIGLRSVTGLFGGAEISVEDVDPDGAGIATFRTREADYAVLGADPHDAGHIMAIDAFDGTLKVSADSGRTWRTDLRASAAIRDDGRFLPSGGRYGVPYSQAISIGFDPNTPGHVMIGTRQNGIIRSHDGGDTWNRVLSTEKIPNVSDFHFLPDGTVIVASYGRGLWKLDFGLEPTFIDVDPEELERLEETPYMPIPESVQVGPPEDLFMVMTSGQVGGVPIAVQGEESELIIWGARPREEAGPVSLSIDGYVVNQDLPIGQDGKIRVSFRIRGMALEEAIIRIEQGYGDELQWDERRVRIVYGDQRDENRG